jgi:cytochrome c oxidase assembly protein subunit 20
MICTTGKLRKALNVGVYSGVGITWASYEFCQYQKRQEATNMKRAVEVVREAKIQKEVAEQDARNAAAAAEAAARLEQTSKRPWYKFW